jgi:hypothetical protein
MVQASKDRRFSAKAPQDIGLGKVRIERLDGNRPSVSSMAL